MHIHPPWCHQQERFHAWIRFVVSSPNRPVPHEIIRFGLKSGLIWNGCSVRSSWDWSPNLSWPFHILFGSDWNYVSYPLERLIVCFEWHTWNHSFYTHKQIRMWIITWLANKPLVVLSPYSNIWCLTFSTKSILVKGGKLLAPKSTLVASRPFSPG
jgi:hypothetical protein